MNIYKIIERDSLEEVNSLIDSMKGTQLLNFMKEFSKKCIEKDSLLINRVLKSDIVFSEMLIIASIKENVEKYGEVDLDNLFDINKLKRNHDQDCRLDKNNNGYYIKKKEV